MKQKLTTVMGEGSAGKPNVRAWAEIAAGPCAPRSLITDADFGGVRSGGTQRRGAARGKSFVSAVATTLDCKLRHVRMCILNGFRKADIAKLARSSFGAGANDVNDRLTWWQAPAKAGLRPIPDGRRQRQEGSAVGVLQLGEHYPRQHQVGVRAHLPPGQPEASRALLRQLRLALYPPLQTEPYDIVADVGRVASQAAAVSAYLPLVIETDNKGLICNKLNKREAS